MPITTAYPDHSAITCAHCEGADRVRTLRIPWPSAAQSGQTSISLCLACREQAARALLNPAGDGDAPLVGSLAERIERAKRLAAVFARAAMGQYMEVMPFDRLDAPIRDGWEAVAGEVCRIELTMDQALAQVVRHRGVRYPEDACLTCHGLGTRAYGSTATWRGGIGGQMITTDVCDACWGSGDRWRPGADLRRLRDEERARVAAAAVDALAQSCGATLESARPQVLEIVAILRHEVAVATRARGRKKSALRESIWFAPLAKGLADMLERAVRAK